MKAALIGADRTLTVADIERPAPAVGEVLIDVRFCGICGSDLHMLGLPADLVPAGHVLGHELTGVVAALGPGVTRGPRRTSRSACSAASARRWSSTRPGTRAAHRCPAAVLRLAPEAAVGGYLAFDVAGGLAGMPLVVLHDTGP